MDWHWKSTGNPGECLDVYGCKLWLPDVPGGAGKWRSVYYVSYPLAMILTTVYHIISKTVSLMSHYLWNSSLIMAEYLQEQKFPVANLNGRWELAIFFFSIESASTQLKKNPMLVLELGSGAGLPGLLAAKMGAKTVCVILFSVHLLRYLNSHPIHRVWKSWNNK